MYVSLVKRDGQFVIVGVPEVKLQLPAFALIFKYVQIQTFKRVLMYGNRRINFAGSLIGSPNEIEEMLELASKNNIAANVQVWPIDEVNEAIENFRKGNPRYRYALQLK